MIIVIVLREFDPKVGRYELVVSHGIDDMTDRVVVMPSCHPSEVGAVFDSNVGEYVIH